MIHSVICAGLRWAALSCVVRGCTQVVTDASGQVGRQVDWGVARKMGRPWDGSDANVRNPPARNCAGVRSQCSKVVLNFN